MPDLRINTLRIIAVFIFSLIAGYLYAQASATLDTRYYQGFYSHEGNNDKVSRDSGHNHYIKFYPGNRVIRLYVPYPYASKVEAATIVAAFDAAAAKSSGSAFIRDKFEVLSQAAVAHLDVYRWVEGKVMYDCGNAAPCEVSFSNDDITIIQPGVVINHKIRYKLVTAEKAVKPTPDP